MSPWVPAYIALGSNLGDPKQQITTAFARLNALVDTRLVAQSRLYCTEPMGPQDQPKFINAAAGLLTQLEPLQLLAELKRIETQMGRIPPPMRWGPRVIDLDLLLHGSTVMDLPQLTLPHPGIHQRNFVLYPLADIAPTVQIPGRGRVVTLMSTIGSDGLHVYGLDA